MYVYIDTNIRALSLCIGANGVNKVQDQHLEVYINDRMEPEGVLQALKNAAEVPDSLVIKVFT